jgi:bcr-type benzoyl-CoA reductase subunit C
MPIIRIHQTSVHDRRQFKAGDMMFEPFQSVVDNIGQTVRTFKQELGRPVIGVMPAYFPLELIEAAGGYPVQLWGNNLPIRQADAHLQVFCCSVARSMLELELAGKAEMVDAYAFTSLCDTLINLREIYRQLFPKPTVSLSMPITQTNKARRVYLAEVLDTAFKGLAAITGRTPTATSLAAAAALCGRTRELQRALYRIRREQPGLIGSHDFYTVIKAGFFLPRDVYNDRLDVLLGQLQERSTPNTKGPRVVLSGLVFDPMPIYRLIDEAGLIVVDDDMANGWRSVSKATLQTDNLVEGITEYLYSPAPCCCLYNPDNDRHAYLVEKTRGAHADGVLFWYVNFCEPDAFDKPQLMERLKQESIRVAAIDVELTMTNFDAIRTRITALSEILGG